MLEIKMTGLEGVLDMLEELPTVAMEKTALRNALKKAAEPMVEQANSDKPPALPGDKAVRISTQAQRGQSYGRGVAFVNIVYAHPLAHLFEAGTTERYTKDGSYRGFMSPQPFVRPAFDENQEKVVEIFSDEIFKQLEKAAARLAKKALAGKLTMGQVKGLRR